MYTYIFFFRKALSAFIFFFAVYAPTAQHGYIMPANACYPISTDCGSALVPTNLAFTSIRYKAEDEESWGPSEEEEKKGNKKKRCGRKDGEKIGARL